MKLLTVRRDGDGTFHQAFIPITEEIDMKLKCTFCVERNGNAVKTDQLFIVSTPTGDKLACMKCKNRHEGRHDHGNSNDQLTRSAN